MPHKFKCMFGKCGRQFCSLAKFKLHITEDHQTEREPSVSEQLEGMANESQHAEEVEEKTQESTEKEVEKQLKHELQTERFYVSRTPTSTKNSSPASITNAVATPNPEQPGEDEQKQKQNKRKRSKTAPAASNNSEPNVKKRRTDERDAHEGDFTTPHCLCRKPDDGKGMIECSKCDSWFHYSCVGLTARKVAAIAHNMEYQCPRCWTQMQRASPSSSQHNKKRKLSELGINELAHLCLELQDRVGALEISLQTAHKQLNIATAFYKKRSWMEREYFP